MAKIARNFKGENNIGYIQHNILDIYLIFLKINQSIIDKCE